MELAMMKKNLITTGAACRLAGGEDTPIHASTLWRWIKAGRISPPIKVGPNTARFDRDLLVRELGIEVAA